MAFSSLPFRIFSRPLRGHRIHESESSLKSSRTMRPLPTVTGEATGEALELARVLLALEGRFRSAFSSMVKARSTSKNR